MNDLYDQKYLKLTIQVLKDNIHDLSLWSVYNEDKYNEEVSALEKHIKHIEEAEAMPF
jgi:hypothetical protein